MGHIIHGAFKNRSLQLCFSLFLSYKFYSDLLTCWLCGAIEQLSKKQKKCI